MKIYLVQAYGQYVDDGWQELGIFSSREKAEKIASKYNKNASKYYQAHVQEYTLDQEIEGD